MSARTPSKPRSPRTLLWVLGAVVGVVALAWIALAVAFPPARVRALVQAQLGSVLAREVRYADAGVGLWPPVRLTVSGLQLAEPGGLARGRALEVASLHFDLDPWALLSRRVTVRRLILDRPQVHLLLRADGTTNFDGVVKEQPSRPASKPMDFEVKELVVRDGRVLVDDLGAKRRTAFALGTRVALASRGGGTRFDTSGDTEIAELAFGPLAAQRLADLNPSLAELRWKVAHRGAFDAEKKRLAFEKLALGFGGTELALSGIVDEPGPKARLDLKAKGSKVDLGDILEFLSVADARALQGIRASGAMDFDLALRGALGRARLPEITGVLRVTNASFRYPGAPAGVDKLRFTARFAPDSLGIGDLVATVSDQPVKAQLAVTRFADPRVFFRVEGNIDLGAIGPLVAPAETKLAGRAAVDVRGSGRAKDPGSIVVDGRARLTDVSVENKDLPNKIEKVQGDVQFSQERASVREFSGRAGKSSFALDGVVTRPLALLAKPGSVPPSHVDFKLRSPYLDLEDLLPKTPGAPILPNATGGGEVEIARLKNAKLDVTAVGARVQLEPGVLAVPEFGLTGYDGRIVGNARFDLRDPATPVYAVKTQAAKVDADALLSTWTPAKGWLRGALNLQMDLSGRGLDPATVARSLTAAGIAGIADGTLGPGPALEAIAQFVKIPKLKQLQIRDGEYPFSVQNGRVLLRESRFNGPTGEWRLAGSVGFDGTLDHAVSITIPPALIAGLGAGGAVAAGALRDEQGRLLLDLRVRGTAKKPQVSWDTQAMRDRLAGRVSTALAEQKQKVEDTIRDAAEQRQRAAEDSARAAIARARKAVEDSLKRRAGGLLDGFFGGRGGKASPSPAPAETTATDSAK